MNKAKAQFYRMLQSLAKAGLPMLRILAQPAPRKLKKAAARLRQAVEGGMPLEELMCKGGEIIVGENKYYVRYRLEAYVNDKLVFEHDYNCEDQEVCIIIPDGGLGDNLAWLPYLEKFRLAGVNWRVPLDDGHVAGLNVILLHFDNHLVDCRDIMTGVMTCKICLWGFDARAAGQQCCCENERGHISIFHF